jgi:hypothetical protein
VKRTFSAISCIVLFAAGAARADWVAPKIGGGQLSASMKHADVTFDGTNIAVHVDPLVPTPVLNPLLSPNEFDPAAAWSVLTNKAYNYQYAWNPGGFISLPSGSGIWVERIHHDPGLQAFLRTPAYQPGIHGPTWPEILTADGDRWQWAGNMQHNVYAVLNPLQSEYKAEYRVYLGDAATGAPLPGYGSANVTFTWYAVPVPEPSGIALVISACLVPVAIFVRGRRRK